MRTGSTWAFTPALSAATMCAISAAFRPFSRSGWTAAVSGIGSAMARSTRARSRRCRSGSCALRFRLRGAFGIPTNRGWSIRMLSRAMFCCQKSGTPRSPTSAWPKHRAGCVTAANRFLSGVLWNTARENRRKAESRKDGWICTPSH